MQSMIASNKNYATKFFDDEHATIERLLVEVAPK
jgi:hypothetical protein